MKRIEAIESLRQVYSGANAEHKAALEALIPELKESEDERIRKRIRLCLNECVHRDIIRDYERDECLAYLEKQKDHQPNIELIQRSWYMEGYNDRKFGKEPKWIIKTGEGGPRYEENPKYGQTLAEEQKPLMSSDGEIEDRKRDIVAAIRKHYRADYAEYLTSFLKRLSPEDNSEDEYGQKMLGIAYKLMYEHIPENLRTKEFWDSLKFMREYTGRVAIIHPYEQPAEWSEEDEDKVDDICKLIEHATIIPRSGDDDTGIPPTRLNDKYKGELKAFVKSLRNCPTKSDTWKPSEEQMDWLESAVKLSINKPHIHGIIISLYEQLKLL